MGERYDGREVIAQQPAQAFFSAYVSANQQ
jgi:hypothetical protein